jgi:hypothetical protein
MPGTWPYEDDETDLEITHEYGEDVVPDVVSTYPGLAGGDGNPQPVLVRKPRP